MIRVGLRALVALSFAFATPSARAQVPTDTTRLTRDSALEARTSAVAAQLRCPVCQGLSIQDSPSELAQSMRSLVRDQLAQGKTPEQVKAYFVSKYGEWILLSPPPHGFNLLAYLFPMLVVLGGGAVIVFAVRRWTTSAPESPSV
ncbi:MAG TPA: cytochrome c-type biogenesis protein [Gemmatimonadaceae bacterium]|nr:cytochrome c-type biogenesis protein [Gemmatimonadaceae bacterium]